MNKSACGMDKSTWDKSAGKIDKSSCEMDTSLLVISTN